MSLKSVFSVTEKSSLVSGRISSLIQDAESKTKKKSSENLNLIRRESPVGSENVENKAPKNVENKATKNLETKTSKNVDAKLSKHVENNVESSSSAPKLPPKPGRSLLCFNDCVNFICYNF